MFKLNIKLEFSLKIKKDVFFLCPDWYFVILYDIILATHGSLLYNIVMVIKKRWFSRIFKIFFTLTNYKILFDHQEEMINPKVYITEV